MFLASYGKSGRSRPGSPSLKDALRYSALLIAAAVLTAGSARGASDKLGAPPAGFVSGQVGVSGASLHYVRGGRGPVVILLHGFPEDWTEYRGILRRLAERFTVVAVDLPGIGKSGPAPGGYDAMTLAREIHGLAEALKLDHPYIVGHDHGGIVTYAYVRSFPDALRGAMILDVPVPGIPGSEEPVPGLWHVGFIQAPKRLAEKLVVGRQAAFLGWFYDLGKFTSAERSYFARAYGAPQLHAAFEFYRALPNDAKWNGDQTSANSVPLAIAFGEKSPFASRLSKFVDGYRAKGMTRVEGATIPDAGHYVVTDNPGAVADLIERYAG